MATAALEPVALDTGPTRWLDRFVPADTELRERLRLRVLRVLIAANLALGFYYITWRFAYINWAVWPLSLAPLTFYGTATGTARGPCAVERQRRL